MADVAVKRQAFSMINSPAMEVNASVNTLYLR
jgi:hypothetical protein